jgi:uncharacterized protein
MLIEFTVGNYRSFKDKVTFSMVAADLKLPENDTRRMNVFSVNGLDLLKTGAIYGANASGKSNLISAMKFLHYFLLLSPLPDVFKSHVYLEPFRLADRTRDQPSFFEISFTVDNKQYRYGFEVSVDRVHSEWLFWVPEKRESRLFFREGRQFKISKAFKEAKGLEERTRNDALLLTVAAQFNGPMSDKIISNLNWLLGPGLTTFSHGSKLPIMAYWELFDTFECFKTISDREAITRFLKKLDLGIYDMAVEARPKEQEERSELSHSRLSDSMSSVTTFHHQYAEDGSTTSLQRFELGKHESHGTQKLFLIAAPLMSALARGGVLIIDELDAQLHPVLAREIIDLFHSPQSNPKNAQLIFTTHDTNLLSGGQFRRDQIWFTEKDSHEASHLYSLVEFKIDEDAPFERDYIAGRYGAIPYIGGLKRLFAEMDDELTCMTESAHGR